jgi:hypothetical protein
MRRINRVGLAAFAAVAVAGCGSAGTFANKPRPATPVNLTVYINDHRVSVSPSRVGAGPVQFIVTNEARTNVSLNIRSGANHGTTGPINPGATDQLTVNMNTGRATVSTGNSIRPATLQIGPPRPSASNALLQP